MKKNIFILLIISLIFITGCDEKGIKVNFDSNGGSKVDSISFECKDDSFTLVLPENPTREGYRFMSWIDINENPIYNEAKLTCSDINLKANWEKLGSITFDSDGGSEVEKLYFEEGTEIKFPENPTKNGYTFLGWYDNNDVYFSDGAKLTKEDITLKAKWKNNTILISSMSFKKSSYDVVGGEKISLSLSVSPSDHVETISYSSNNSICKVDNKGVVTTSGIGECTITAKSSKGKSATTKVYSNVKGISLTTSTSHVSINDGYNAMISFKIDSKYKDSIKESDIKWTYSNIGGQNDPAYITKIDNENYQLYLRNGIAGMTEHKLKISVSIGHVSKSVDIISEKNLELSYAKDNQCAYDSVSNRYTCQYSAGNQRLHIKTNQAAKFVLSDSSLNDYVTVDKGNQDFYFSGYNRTKDLFVYIKTTGGQSLEKKIRIMP